MQACFVLVCFNSCFLALVITCSRDCGEAGMRAGVLACLVQTYLCVSVLACRRTCIQASFVQA